MESVAKVGALKERRVSAARRWRAIVFLSRGAGAAQVTMEKGSKRSSAKCAGALPKPSAEFVGEELARLDVTLPVLRIEGCSTDGWFSGYGEYMTAAGPVRCCATVTVRRAPTGRANARWSCVLGSSRGSLPAGRADGLVVVTHLTPAEGERLFGELGGMHPHAAAWTDCPRRLTRREQHRMRWESQLREQAPPLAQAAVLAVSLDG
ncbi:MAG: hypothetical protein IPI02_10415 [Sterolibacteriaceae bacterium]|nr:hypothetical protein [Sterolibacteriaceae bacterium]